MNSKQDNKFGMYLAVQDVCEDSSTVWAGVPAFGATFTKFTASVARIQQLAQKQGEGSTGATADKQRCREQMCDAALVIAQALRVYAVEQSRLELASQVGFSRSALLAGRDRVSAERCQTIHRFASEQIANLATHGITAAKLQDLQTRIDAYLNCLQRPRQIITENKTATAQLEVEFELADGFLTDGLDGLVLQFKESQPVFYGNYTNARVIVNNASGHESEEPSASQAKAA